jgi:hypothetical protein
MRREIVIQMAIKQPARTISIHKLDTKLILLLLISGNLWTSTYSACDLQIRKEVGDFHRCQPEKLTDGGWRWSQAVSAHPEVAAAIQFTRP